MTLKSLLGTLEIIIQNHFKSHMLGLMLIGIVSFPKLLEIGMHSLHLLYPLLNVLRIASLYSHRWWDLGTSPLIRWPWWMYVSWCVTSKLFWFWFMFTVLDTRHTQFSFIGNYNVFLPEQLLFNTLDSEFMTPLTYGLVLESDIQILKTCITFLINGQFSWSFHQNDKCSNMIEQNILKM